MTRPSQIFDRLLAYAALPKYSWCSRRYGKEVYGHKVFGVILEERAPRL